MSKTLGPEIKINPHLSIRNTISPYGLMVVWVAPPNPENNTASINMDFIQGVHFMGGELCLMKGELCSASGGYDAAEAKWKDLLTKSDW
jgi:hypothetical protein